MNKNYIAAAWICILSLYISLSSFAETSGPYTLKQIDSRNGLSNSSINYLFQDSDNLLWVATWDGLNVYDGSGFHVFNYSKENISKSIGNNVILKVSEDKKGFIWISTIEGVSRYDKNTGEFSNYFYENKQNNRVSEREYTVVIDKSGDVYCLTQKFGLMIYDPVSDQFKPKNSSLERNIIKFRFDNENHLWTLSKNGVLNIYDIQASSFKKLASFKQKSPFTDFFYVNNQILGVTAAKQLIKISSSLQESEVANLEYDVKDIIFYKDRYLFAWSVKGYDIFDSSFKLSTFLKTEMEPLKSMKLYSFTSGKDGILWCGTDGSGLIKISQEKRNFGLVNRFNSSSYSNIKQVRAFCELGSDLWVGTKGNGIIVLKNFTMPSGKSEGAILYQGPVSLNNNSVYTIKKGKENLLYIGSDGKGIGIYDISKKKFIKWAEVIGTDKFPSFGSVYSIIQDEDSSLWLGTSGYGLIHLKIDKTSNGRFNLSYLKQYTYNGNDSGPGNDIICFLEKGESDRIWLACRYGGLSVFDKRSQKFKTFKAFSYEGSLSHNDVLSLYKDKEKRLWIGTSYGLNWIDESDVTGKKPLFKKLTIEDGLPNNTIHAIQEASGNHIWISTNKGLARINPSTLQVERFQQTDGLQSNEFCDGAAWKSPEGYLLFGGIFGFNYFMPERISSSKHQTNVLISDLHLGGKLYNENSLALLKPGQKRIVEYTLEPSYNYFDFNVKAINFVNSDKSEYAYFLEGYDKIWHYSGTSFKISYFNIPPGKYKLKLKWSNGEGKWTAETTVFQVTIKQFLWKSWPALLAYLLILGAGGYALYRYRRNKLEMKHNLDIERMLRHKDEEVHQEQLSFFTNITHELQTPLTLINGSVERFFYKNDRTGKHPREYYFLSVVHQQSSRLMYLVNQLLDFRKAEAGYLKNQYIYLDISSLLGNIAELFVPLCDQKNLDYTIEIHPDIAGFIDKDKLEKIIFNLLSNAFKHSGNDQKIVFEVKVVNKNLNVIVKNSGCELTDEQLSQIFDKFFVVDASQHVKYSNGIGLAFTRQLIELLQGKITVVNNEGWIEFCAEMPLEVKSELLEHEATENPLVHTPSYLLRSITSDLDDKGQLNTKENNKRALIADLEEAEKKSILVVEDEPGIRFLLKDLLEEHYIIYEAENGRQAIELLKIVSPNLIISDVMMPDINGLELCNKVKNSPDTCHIPFIMLSARGSIDQKTEGYDAGADAYIPKPFDTMHLLVRVRKLLEYRQRLYDIFKKDGPATSLEEKNLADGDKQFLNKLVQIIEENIEDTELDAAYLETQLALSKMQLYRKLKSLSNMTPAEFIKHIRLQRTVELLQTTQLTVSEIFYRSGFNNQSYFFREFKKRYQCSPNEYRAQQRIHV